MTCLMCRDKNVVDFGVKVPKKFLCFSWEALQKQPLCRIHLLAEYRKSFTASQGRLVVFYPDLEYKKKGYYQYNPIPIHAFEAFCLNNNKQEEIHKELKILNEAFQQIRGDCKKCGNHAQCAFFSSGSFAWKQLPFTQITTSDQLVISSVSSQPEILCMDCCYSKIEPSFSECDLNIVGLLCAIPEKGDHCLIGIEE